MRSLRPSAWALAQILIFYIIRVDLKNMWPEGEEWIHLAVDKVQAAKSWHAFYRNQVTCLIYIS
jgi:hypothetical protein